MTERKAEKETTEYKKKSPQDRMTERTNNTNSPKNQKVENFG